MSKEECGFCGRPDGVRFGIPGTQRDGAMCPDCVRAAVSAHAEAGSPQLTEARTARAEKKFFGPDGGV